LGVGRRDARRSRPTSSGRSASSSGGFERGFWRRRTLGDVPRTDQRVVRAGDQVALLVRVPGEAIALLLVALQDQVRFKPTVRSRLRRVLGPVEDVHLRRRRLRRDEVRVLRHVCHSGAPNASVHSVFTGRQGRFELAKHARRARLTSPSWLIFWVISIFAETPAKPPASPRSSSYLRASISVSSRGSRTSAIMR
jgi:hypothetical protein